MPTNFIDEVESLVDKIEKSTAADIVVTMASHSGTYADIELAVGFVCASLGLIFIMQSPWAFDPLGVYLDLAVTFLAGWGVARKLPGLVRWLAPATRRRRQVDKAAAAAVHTTGMTHTRERDGLLIHLSTLEQAAAVIPDIGLEHVLPPGTVAKLCSALEDALQHPHPQTGVLNALGALQEILSQCCPADDRPHQIPCRPRVLS